MKINHHPNDESLLDYASGAMREAWSIAVSTHITLCSKCRGSISEIEAIGGSMLSQMPPTSSNQSCIIDFEKIINNDFLPCNETAKMLTKIDIIEKLPNPLNNYLGKSLSEISWKSLGFGASQFLIPIDDKSATARLIKISAGKKVPKHSHQGLEMTLVLSGSFSDNTGHYTVGDLQEANEELDHQPHASSLSNCICLAITDAPLRFNSLTARLIQPIIGI
jgi:putative transcriptional regulator